MMGAFTKDWQQQTYRNAWTGFSYLCHCPVEFWKVCGILPLEARAIVLWFLANQINSIICEEGAAIIFSTTELMLLHLSMSFALIGMLRDPCSFILQIFMVNVFLLLHYYGLYKFIYHFARMTSVVTSTNWWMLSHCRVSPTYPTKHLEATIIPHKNLHMKLDQLPERIITRPRPHPALTLPLALGMRTYQKRAHHFQIHCAQVGLFYKVG